MNKIKAGMHIRFIDGTIGKIAEYEFEKEVTNGHCFYLESNPTTGSCCEEGEFKVSHNIIDLIEYMDLLNIENPIKLYDEEIEVSLFNPVRCDGFAIYEDGTTCIILNLDYFVDVNTLKIKSIVTKEQYSSMEYKV